MNKKWIKMTLLFKYFVFSLYVSQCLVWVIVVKIKITPVGISRFQSLVGEKPVLDRGKQFIPIPRTVKSRDFLFSGR